MNTIKGNRPAVVVLNMHYSGLGIARALRGTGIPVWGLVFDDNFIGARSRDCRSIRYPDPAREPRAALEFLCEFAQRFDEPPLLLPTRDLDLSFILENRASIESHYLLALPPSPVMERILDKSRLAAAAKSVGIECPDEVHVSGRDDLERARDRIGFPCIVKPIVASRWRHGPIYEAVARRKVIMFETWEELRDFYARIENLDGELLVQQYVPGGDDRLLIFGSYFNAKSGLLRFFTAKKLLQSPPVQGTGIAVQATPIPEIVDMSIVLLETLDYTGISEIEYKHDARTGRYFLIEVNSRHWDQHALGVPAGVNLTLAMYQDIVGQPVAEMSQRPEPVSWIAEEGYLIGLRDALLGKGYPLRQYLSPLASRKSWATFDWSDPRPSLRLLRGVAGEYARAGRSLAHRWLRRLRTTPAH